MPFEFKRSWTFDNPRLLDTGDLDNLQNPESDVGQALLDFFNSLALGVALPPGGTTGMVLTKASAAPGDAQWVALVLPLGVPSGGASGQVLVKTGSEETDLGWTNLPAPANAAASVTYDGSAGLTSANVEAALDELDTEKAPVVHSHAQADVTGLVTALAAKVATVTSGIQIDSGPTLPAAGQAGRFWIQTP